MQGTTSSHWTYEAPTPERDLFQGDILERTEEICQAFDKTCPHFLNTDYASFLLITQSCDLARRKGRCDVEYLNIAAVRPLDAILDDLLSHVCKPVAHGVYLQEQKTEAHRLLERVFNQNEQALGLFYLHPDPSAGIACPSVAMLRVTVSIPADCYDVLLKARRGSLIPAFRSKLGWLVGNLYSRVGTEDWSDPPERKRELRNLLSQYIDTHDDLDPVWVPQDWVSAAKEQGLRLEGLSKKEVFSTLEKHKPPLAKERAADQAVEVIRGVCPALGDETLVRIRNRLKNDGIFSKAVHSGKSEPLQREGEITR